MVKKKPKQNDRRMAVSVSHVAAPDGRSRLSHAIGILLKTAADANSRTKGTSYGEKGTPQSQAGTEDASSGGSRGNDSRVKDKANPNCGNS